MCACACLDTHTQSMHKCTNKHERPMTHTHTLWHSMAHMHMHVCMCVHACICACVHSACACCMCMCAYNVLLCATSPTHPHINTSINKPNQSINQCLCMCMYTSYSWALMHVACAYVLYVLLLGACCICSMSLSKASSNNLLSSVFPLS